MMPRNTQAQHVGRNFRLLVLSLVGLVLLGCGSQDPDLWRMGLAAPPQNLDPRYATDATSARVNRLLYARLVEFDSASLPAPSLARWEQLTPRHYRFTLGNEGRTFSDGSRLTATDVAATYSSMLDPKGASPHREVLTIIERLRVLDAERIDFFIERADPLFPAYLAIGILPASAIARGHSFTLDPIGSGPFCLAAPPRPGRLVLERRGDGRRIELTLVKDPNVRVMKLLRGEIDLLQNDLAPELVDYLARRDQVRLARVPGSNFSYLGFNMEDERTSQLAVRWAIAHAIDREAIIRYLFRGGARPAAGLFPPEHWAGHGGLATPTHDVERARQLLTEAGYGPQRPLRLVYKTSSDPFRIRLGTVIQAQLAAVGIELDVQSLDWGTFYGDIKAGRFQLYSLTWVGVHTPDIFRYAFHSESEPPKGANRGRYRNPRIDELIDRAASELDRPRQAALYRELQARLLEDLPVVPLWYEHHFSAVRAELRGYRLASDGNYDGLVGLEWAAPSSPSDSQNRSLR